MEPVVHRWLDRLKSRKGASRTTIATYTSVMRQLTAWNDGKPVLYLEEGDVGRWVDHMTREGLDPGTRRTYLGTAAQFFGWCVREGLRADDPCVGIERPKSRRRLPRPMPEQELARALKFAAGDAPMRAILALAAFAGLRACEVAGLSWRDVQLDATEPHLTVVWGKGGHERVVDVSPELAEILLALPHRVGPVIPRLDGRPGPNAAYTISHRAGQFLTEIGIGRGLHSLRHRFCTIAYVRSKDLRAVQEAAGHADPSTTAKYAAVSRVRVREIVLQAGRLQAS